MYHNPFQVMYSSDDFVCSHDAILLARAFCAAADHENLLTVLRFIRSLAMWDGEDSTYTVLKLETDNRLISTLASKLKRSRLNIAGYLGGRYFEGYDPENDYRELQTKALSFLDSTVGRSATPLEDL